MLSAMDDAIGRVLKAVRDTGSEENTLVCFISDNGGPITRNAPNHSRNTPLRGGKGETWEGGIRVPFFIKWKGQLKPGTTYGEPVTQMDLSATVLATAGVKLDSKWPMDGVNLMPFLTGERKGVAPHDILCWEYGPQWAIRDGQWKLTYALPHRDAQEPVPGLYDLSQDIGENHDLSAEHPLRVRQMRAAWEKWRENVSENPLSR
jgi:arylsulfatase A-like enzyme